MANLVTKIDELLCKTDMREAKTAAEKVPTELPADGHVRMHSALNPMRLRCHWCTGQWIEPNSSDGSLYEQIN